MGTTRTITIKRNDHLIVIVLPQDPSDHSPTKLFDLCYCTFSGEQQSQTPVTIRLETLEGNKNE